MALRASCLYLHTMKPSLFLRPHLLRIHLLDLRKKGCGNGLALLLAVSWISSSEVEQVAGFIFGSGTVYHPGFDTAHYSKVKPPTNPPNALACIASGPAVSLFILEMPQAELQSSKVLNLKNGKATLLKYLFERRSIESSLLRVSCHSTAIQRY